MKKYIKKTISKLISLPILMIAGGATQVQSLLLKSEIQQITGRQNVVVYFTEGQLRSNEVTCLVGENFSEGKFKHDDRYREMSETDLTQIIKEAFSPDERIKTVKLHFRNISTTAQLDLLNDYMFHMNQMAFEMIKKYPTRLNWIDVAYLYWDDKSNPLYLEGWRRPEGFEEARIRFEQSMEYFRNLQKQIQARREEGCVQRMTAMATQRQLAFPYP